MLPLTRPEYLTAPSVGRFRSNSWPMVFRSLADNSSFISMPSSFSRSASEPFTVSCKSLPLSTLTSSAVIAVSPPLSLTWAVALIRPSAGISVPVSVVRDVVLGACRPKSSISPASMILYAVTPSLISPLASICSVCLSPAVSLISSTSSTSETIDKRAVPASGPISGIASLNCRANALSGEAIDSIAFTSRNGWGALIKRALPASSSLCPAGARGVKRVITEQQIITGPGELSGGLEGVEVRALFRQQ